MSCTIRTSGPRSDKSVDLTRAGISHSDHLVDIKDLPLTPVEDRADGGLHIGALARMTDEVVDCDGR
jgi:xanthine dehydrogenase YagS FAD-binding subunit